MPLFYQNIRWAMPTLLATVFLGDNLSSFIFCSVQMNPELISVG
ncbi:MAG: hypothetical protein RIE73_09020 [Coleofasciculus sp. C1-SOL-03]